MKRALTWVQYMRSLTVVIPRGPGLLHQLCVEAVHWERLFASQQLLNLCKPSPCVWGAPLRPSEELLQLFPSDPCWLLFTASWSPCSLSLSPRTATIPERKGRLFLGRILAPLDFHISVIPSIEGKGFSSVTET